MEYIYTRTRGEAWKAAAEIFPTDYEKDEQSSKNAGYPIFRSTSQPNAWISNLNNGLELNFEDKDGTFRTIMIGITDEQPKKTTSRFGMTGEWSSDAVRRFCMYKKLYTDGSLKDFSNMLDMVAEGSPTIERVYKVAEDIYRHSSGAVQAAVTMPQIMGMIASELVTWKYVEI